MLFTKRKEECDSIFKRIKKFQITSKN